MLQAKPATTTCSSRSPGIENFGPVDSTLYRSLVGVLQYLSLTRPDIDFAINTVSQHLHAPTSGHFAVIKRILHYIAGTLDFGLALKRSSTFSLTAYFDADLAGCPDTRWSITGSFVFFGPNLISWSSKKRHTVSRSSTGALFYQEEDAR
uniref:Uncharacterized mitochondrial protein AtMg00810-like n=1 Tax=Nicotiana tabacum TaxID=4097 RepID=A0A1S4D9R8_TOBAC